MHNHNLNHNHDKYITIPEFDRLTVENFKARLAQANSITKANFDTELKKISDRVMSNKTKHLLVENELRKLKAFDFKEDGTQNYLVFQPMRRSFKSIADVGNGNFIYFWKSKGLFDERINSITTSDCSIIPKLRYYAITVVK